MRGVSVVFLHAFVTQAHAKEMVSTQKSDTQDSTDKLADRLIDKLVDKLLGFQMMTPGRATPFLSLRSASPSALGPQSRSMTPQVQAAKDNLRMHGMGYSPLENLALTAIDVNNRGNGRRDVSLQAMKAQQSQLASGWDLTDTQVREKLAKVVDEVEAKSSVVAGVTAPMNFFDPLGFATSAPTTGGKLLFYREVELKHGRVAMLASLGFLVGEQFHPLFGGDIDVPSYFAFQQTPLETFWPAVVAAIAIPEVFSVFTFQDPAKGETWAMKTDHIPGDLGFDPLGLKPKDPREFTKMQTKELNNGRLAMIAAAGMIAQEYITGQKLF